MPGRPYHICTSDVSGYRGGECLIMPTRMIPLPQREQAYVFATGEYRGRAVFAISAFTTGRDQTIELQPTAMTKEQVSGIVSHLDLNQLSIRVADSRNAAQIRAIDTSLARIARFKPQYCDCECNLDVKGDTSVVEGYLSPR